MPCPQQPCNWYTEAYNDLHNSHFLLTSTSRVSRSYVNTRMPGLLAPLCTPGKVVFQGVTAGAKNMTLIGVPERKCEMKCKEGREMQDLRLFGTISGCNLPLINSVLYRYYNQNSKNFENGEKLLTKMGKPPNHGVRKWDRGLSLMKNQDWPDSAPGLSFSISVPGHCENKS